MSIENPASEVNVSLSPESGSLFHFYHSKLTKTGEDPEKSLEKQDSAAQRPPRTFNRNYMSSKKAGKNAPPYSSSRLQKYPLLGITDYVLADEEADRHCSKTFHLKDSTNEAHGKWTLPPVDALYVSEEWKVDALLQMKSELNDVKSQLDEFDIEAWHKHTHTCNPAYKIPYSVKCKAKPPLLTQAFLKFYEMVHAFPVVPEEPELADGWLRSLHLCEAPGAFVVALNHFLAISRPDVKWRWMGNTLNPHFEGTPSSECIADDRLILATPDNWCFGGDETGNLMRREYLAELEARLGGEASVDIVTADGSIDCQGNPAEQESMTHRLHFCEVYAALRALKRKGSLVLKQFTFFEAESINLLYLVCCSFDDVCVYKPITSKLGNSEVYIIATGYEPLPILDQYLKALHRFYGEETLPMTMFGEDQVPSSFVDQIVSCCGFFKTRQVNAIQRNIHLYNNQSDRNQQYCELLKSIVLRKYLEKNICSPIDHDRKIVPYKLEWDREIIPESNVAKWGGQIKKKPKPQRLKFLNDQFDSLVKFYSSKECKKREHSQDSKVLQCLSLKEGKPFHFVYVSRFCNVNLMQIYVHYFMECASEEELTKVLSGHFLGIQIFNSDSYTALSTRKAEKAKLTVAKEHSNATVLDEGHFSAPHGCHEALNALLELMRDGKLEERTDVAVLNCPLLTRRQNGLLFALSSLFEKVVFHEPADICEEIPFFVLTNFASVDEGKLLVETLRGSGWHGTNPQKAVNQVLPLQLMIRSPLHTLVCRYNALYCTSHINSLKSWKGN